MRIVLERAREGERERDVERKFDKVHQVRSDSDYMIFTYLDAETPDHQYVQV